MKVFISNVLTGTVSRLGLFIAGGKFLLLRKALVASGYIHRPDAVTFEVGPTGLVYDAQHDMLYVASTGDNEVFAFRMQETGVLHCRMVRVQAQSSIWITSTCTGPWQ